MKLAIVCDDLIQNGGAEKVLEAISDAYPDSPIYTSIVSNKWLEKFKNKKRVVKTSFLQKFPLSSRLYRYYSPFLLHVLAFESFDFSDFDIVLSCSSRYAHFISTKPETKHICYMHSPGRMFWEPFDYFENEKYGILQPLKSVSSYFLKLPLSYLRIADFNASKRVDLFITNSRYSQNRIRKYYGKDSEIVYPFFDIENIKDNLNGNIKKNIVEDKYKDKDTDKDSYFLILTRLLPWKKVDVAIESCNRLNLSLKIIGDGPDMKRLKSLGGTTVKFLGPVSDEEKIDLLKGCEALIVTQREDFGIVPLEAMICGKPVIAFSGGGVKETVVKDKTGVFFDKQNSDVLESVLRDFDPSLYLPRDCISRAKEFDKSIFLDKLRKLIVV